MKSGNLNFLEASGPLQACNGNALSLTLQLLNFDFGTKALKNSSDYEVHSRIVVNGKFVI